MFSTRDQGTFVLGIPWLRRWSPRIDWKTGHLQWDEAREERPGSGLSESPQLHGTVAREGRTQSALPERPQLYGIAAHENEREGPEDGLSGRAGLLRVVVLSDNADQLDAIPPQYRKYRKLFQEELETGLPAHSQFDHDVPLKEGQHPKFHRIYPLNRVQEAALEEYLEENLRKGYIRPSTSPRGIPDPIRTKEGRTTTTLCRLQTAQRHYNQESIPSAVDFGTTRQTTRSLDLYDARSKGSIQSDPNSRRGRVEDRFSNKAGTLLMPFELTNAPASFQAMINHVLRNYLDQFVVVYLDDILIFSETPEEHERHVHQVLVTLEDAQLFMEPGKAKWHAQEVKYLGYCISPGKIGMDPEKSRAIRDWPRPQNVKDVRSVLGFMNFYLRFVKGYSQVATPLAQLTKKDQAFEWKESQQQAFDKLKELILQESILTIPDSENPFKVETDASEFALGGQLGQRDEKGRLHPVAFYSKKLNGPELNYQIHDKELMAIIEAVREWKHYLTGTKHPVKVYTDHKNLTNFTITKALNKRKTRWAEFLSEFNFTIIYRKGTENGRTDALSRRSDLEPDIPPQQS